jgi:hypothetical protein
MKPKDWTMEYCLEQAAEGERMAKDAEAEGHHTTAEILRIKAQGWLEVAAEIEQEAKQ